jgi:hypothetical protein
MDIFTMWFDNFVKFVKKTPEEAELLISDGNYSHSRNNERTEKPIKSFHICLSAAAFTASQSAIKCKFHVSIRKLLWTRNNRSYRHFMFGFETLCSCLQENCHI